MTIMEELVLPLLKEFGFPAAIALILLYDKMKTNGSLRKVVENNNEILKEIKEKIC